MKLRKIAAVVLAVSLGLAVHLSAAAPQQPVEMAADVIEYDAATGVMTGRGGVRFTQDDAVLTGANATYNVKTKQAHITGGVRLVQGDSVLTAAELKSCDNTHVVATGGVVLVKDQSTLTGPQLDYYSDKGYAVINSNARLTMPDGVMTADRMEAYLDINQVTGTGNVHIVSDTRQLDATSDQAVYYGNKEEQARAVLSGNARAVQQGNVLVGNTLTIYLDENKNDLNDDLVIQPQQ